MTEKRCNLPSPWEWMPLPSACELSSNWSSRKKARWAKIMVHKLFPQAALTIWCDASLRINCDLNEFIAHSLPAEMDLAVPYHPDRKTPAEEAEACLKFEKDDRHLIHKQHLRNKELGIAYQHGLPQTGIFIRRQGKSDISHFLETWWSELHRTTIRDQLSFNAALHQSPVPIHFLKADTIGTLFMQNSYKLRKIYRSPVGRLLDLPFWKYL